MTQTQIKDEGDKAQNESENNFNNMTGGAGNVPVV